MDPPPSSSALSLFILVLCSTRRGRRIAVVHCLLMLAYWRAGVVSDVFETCRTCRTWLMKSHAAWRMPGRAGGAGRRGFLWAFSAVQVPVPVQYLATSTVELL